MAQGSLRSSIPLPSAQRLLWNGSFTHSKPSILETLGITQKSPRKGCIQKQIISIIPWDSWTLSQSHKEQGKLYCLKGFLLLHWSLEKILTGMCPCWDWSWHARQPPSSPQQLYLLSICHAWNPSASPMPHLIECNSLIILWGWCSDYFTLKL